jgi:hypothetical protein
MERDQMTLAEETRALLAEQGIEVTDEGLARARQRLREAERRMTPQARARIDAIFGLDQSAA